MANYKAINKVLTTVDQDILVAGAGVEQTVRSIGFFNSSGASVDVTLTVYRSIEATDYPMKLTGITAGTNQPFPVMIVLNAGDKIKAKASAAGGAITMTGAFLEKAGSAPVATGITPRGDYAAGTTYTVNDLVVSGGKSYLSRVAANVGNTPASSPTQWMLFTDPSAMGLVATGRTLTGAGLVAAIGDLSADRTITVPAAVAADILAATSTSKAVTPKSLADILAWAPLTDASTVAWDTAIQGINGRVTLGGNRTIGAPTNLIDGDVYAICLVQDGTGSRTASWNAIWDWGTGTALTLPTAAGKRAIVVAIYENSKLRILSTWKEA